MNRSYKEVSSRSRSRRMCNSFELNSFSLLHQGHTDKINALDGSPDLRFIVSASQDCSARVWYLDDALGGIHRLLAVMKHTSAVTTVKFIGPEGPVLTGTEGGQVRLWSLNRPEENNEDWDWELEQSDAKVVDICVMEDGPAYDEAEDPGRFRKEHVYHWHVGIAYGFKMARWKQLERRESLESAVAYKMTLKHELSHRYLQLSPTEPHTGHDVLKVRFVPRSASGSSDACSEAAQDPQAAWVATLVVSSVVLWNEEGELVAILQGEASSMMMHSLAIIGQQSAGLFKGLEGIPSLVISGSHGEESSMISVWPLQDGRPVTTLPNHRKSWSPAVTYHKSNVSMGVAASVNALLVLRHDNSFAVFHLKLDNDMPTRVIDPSSTLASTAKSACMIGLASVLTLQETSNVAVLAGCKVSAMLLAESFEHDQASQLAFGDIHGTIRVYNTSTRAEGEVVSNLRSLSTYDLVFPVLEKLIASIQIAKFAFNKELQWNIELVRPVEFVGHLACFNLELYMTVDVALIFWCKAVATFFTMLVFVVAARTDALLAIDRYALKSRQRQSDMELGPVLHSAASQSISTVSREPAFTGFIESNTTVFINILKAALRKHSEHIAHGVRMLLLVFMRLGSSILVLPIAVCMAETVDCVVPGSSFAIEDGARQLDYTYLTKVPSIHCYEGAHLSLVIAIFVVGSIYLIMQPAFAVVDGDANYVHASEIFVLKAWKKNARRKVASMYLGAMQKSLADYSHLPGDISEVLVKVLAPCITGLTASKPILQICSLSALAAAQYGFVIYFKPLSSDRSSEFLRGLKLWVLCVMLCGLLSAIIQDQHRVEPFICLALVCVLVPCYTLWKASAIEDRKVTFTDKDQPVTSI